MWKKGEMRHVTSDAALVSPGPGVLYEDAMIIACPACATRYVVPNSAIGVDGRVVRCAKCRKSWFQEGPEIELVGSDLWSQAEEPAAPATETAPEPASVPPSQAEPSPQPTEAVDRSLATQDDGLAKESKATGGLAPDADEFSVAPALKSQVDTSSSPLVYDDMLGQFDDNDAPSNFAHAPPFRRRRNWNKIGMVAGIVFATLALGASVALASFGLPDWFGEPSASTFAPAQPDLVIDFPPDRQDRRTLANGTEFYGASGKVTNIGKTTQYVPSILIVMRDARGRIVYSWEVVPSKRELAPGETLNINEAVTDVPKSAVLAEIGWKPD
jgi:predicted Zn finger-like uncharacterized protein